MKGRIERLLIAVTFVLFFASMSAACGELPKMDTPTGLSISGETLTWDKVSDAKKYVVMLKSQTVSYVTVDVASYNLSEIKDNGVYEISVSAVGEKGKYNNSEFSSSIRYYCGNGIINMLEYKETVGGYEICGFKEKSLPLLYLPSYINGKPVVKISDKAFLGDKVITDVLIPDTIKEIGLSAFYFCKNISRVSVQGGFLSIGKEAFLGCSSLKRVVFNDCEASIEDRAFYNCVALTLYSYSNIRKIGNNVFYGSGIKGDIAFESVTSIGHGAFKNCDITSVALGKKLKQIGESVFDGNNRLSKITVDSDNGYYLSAGGCLIERQTNTVIVGTSSANIPDSVTAIGGGAFCGRELLTEININNGVREIGNMAFAGSGLTKVALPASVTKVGDGAFKDCAELSEVVWSENCTTLPESVFYNCQKLKSISSVDSVSEICEKAFYKCYSLSSINLSQSVTKIGNFAFFSSGLIEITLPSDLQEIGTTVFSDCKLLQKAVLCDNLVDVPLCLFANCSKLKSVTLGSRVRTIGDYAFSRCDALSNITFPDSLNIIGKYAFYACVTLTNVEFPVMLKNIGEWAFGFTAITEIFLPPSIHGVGAFAFNTPVLKIIYNGLSLGGLLDFPDSLEYATLINTKVGIVVIGASKAEYRFPYLTLYVKEGITISQDDIDKYKLNNVNIVYGCTFNSDQSLYSVTRTEDSLILPRKNEIVSPKRKGYTFGGWVTLDDSGKIIKTYQSSEIASLPVGATVYANWIKQ